MTGIGFYVIFRGFVFPTDLAGLATVGREVVPAGREIVAKQSANPEEQAKLLAAALTPFAERYPMPFFRVEA